MCYDIRLTLLCKMYLRGFSIYIMQKLEVLFLKFLKKPRISDIFLKKPIYLSFFWRLHEVVSCVICFYMKLNKVYIIYIYTAVTVEIAKLFILDYRFITNPSFQPTFMESYHKVRYVKTEYWYIFRLLSN